MRIAIYSDNFYPELSGISDSLIALAQELAKRGHFIHFFVPRYSKDDHTLSNLSGAEIDLGPNVGITRFSSFYYGAGSGQGRLVIPYGRIAAVREFNPDVIHTQTFFGVGIEALIASYVLGKPLVGTNHTAIKEFLRYNPLKSAWSDKLVVKYVNWYYSRCITVTAPSKSVFEEMDADGFEKKGIVLSNPIDTDTFRPLEDRDAIRKKLGVGNYPIIHAGRLATERSIDVIIRALPLVQKEIPEAELVISGRGVAEQDLRALAAELGVADSVKFLGFVEQSTLIEAYNAGRVFAITSTADTQSLVMMQAMACGIPVVGVRARALPEYINDTNGFLVEPGDSVALAERIVQILKSEPLQAKLGAGGRATALKYSPPAIAEQWEKIYQDAKAI
jgi:glycosyltransferase involved in cell wall biosynthesis